MGLNQFSQCPTFQVSVSRPPELPKGYIRHPKTILDHLRNYRIMAGLTQEQLAKAIGVAGQTLYLWERGVTKPNKQNMARLLTFMQRSYNINTFNHTDTP